MRQRKRCRNCPEPPVEAPSKIAIDTHILSVSGEADRLWKHVMVGTGTCIGMCKAYVDIEMPGDPLPGLRDLRDRLQAIIEKREKFNANRNRTNG